MPRIGSNNSVVPPMMGRLVAVHAFSQLLTNPLLARAVYNSKETFSTRGLEIIETTTASSNWSSGVQVGGDERRLHTGLAIHNGGAMRSGTRTTEGRHADSSPSSKRSRLPPEQVAKVQVGLLIDWVFERPEELFAELRTAGRSSTRRACRRLALPGRRGGRQPR